MPTYTRETFKAKLNEVLQAENHGDISLILSEAEDAFNQLYSEYDDYEASNRKLKEENESLVKANSKLFLSRGVDITDSLNDNLKKVTFNDLIK